MEKQGEHENSLAEQSSCSQGFNLSDLFLNCRRLKKGHI